MDAQTTIYRPVELFIILNISLQNYRYCRWRVSRGFKRQSMFVYIFSFEVERPVTGRLNIYTIIKHVYIKTTTV